MDSLSDATLRDDLKKLEKIRSSSKGQITKALADALGDVGVSYQEVCEFQKSLDYHFESLDMKKQLFKENLNQHSIADNYNNIAVTYSKMGDLKNALQYHMEALNMRKNLIRGVHPYIATALSNVGVAYDKMSISIIYFELLKAIAYGKLYSFFI